MDTALTLISKAIADGERFLVAAHANPDGDAIGSTFALGHILKAMGKDVRLYNATGMPGLYDWLKAPVPLETELPEEDFDWIFALDSGAPHRLGDPLAARFGKTGTVNIDHHLGNPEYGEINWVDTKFSSVGEMVARLAIDLGIPLTGDLGEAIYVAVVTDTGYFSFGNTRPETLELAAEILRRGLDPAAFNAKLQNQWSLGRLKLWSRVFETVELHLCDHVGLIRITDAMFAETGTTSEDTDGVVNYVRRVKSVKAAISLREDGPRTTKISLRSSGDVNVQAIAAELGGGGHKNASGCVVNLPMDMAQAVVLEAAQRHLGCK